MIQRKENRVQNQDSKIGIYVSNKINGNPVIAAIYARINPIERKFSNSVQTKVWSCWDFCKEKGWNVEYIFIDRHEKMDKMHKHNFDIMLHKANRGDIDVLVFWNLDIFDNPISQFLQNGRKNRLINVWRNQ